MAKKKLGLSERAPLFPDRSRIPCHFLGWDKPILQSACDFLADKYIAGQVWDMTRCVAVLPGGLAGRRLATLIAQRGAAQGLVVRPPDIITMGKLPELLYKARLPFASDLEQTLAWTKVLRRSEAEFLKPLLIELPDRSDIRPWMDLAKLLSSLHRELSSDLVDFEDVQTSVQDEREAIRWEILAELQRRYLAELHEAGLWDLQTARRYAIDNDEVQTERDVVLIGAADLNQAQSRFLSKIADRVQVLIGAPKSYEGGFHPDGTLAPPFWQNLEIPLCSEQIHVRSTASEAAKELAIQLAVLGDAVSVSDITVGIPDASVVPVLNETLSDYGVSLRYGPGESLANSPPMKLLSTIIEFVSTRSIESFNQIVRIPTVEKWLAEQEPILELLLLDKRDKPPSKSARRISLLSALDKYQEATLIRTVDQVEWPEVFGKEIFHQTVACIRVWLEPLTAPKNRLEDWAAPIRSTLKTAYQPLEVDIDDPLGNTYLRATQQINDMLDKLTVLPTNLDTEVTLQEAYTWILGQLERGQIPPLHGHNEVEMLGWLELSMDDAPVLMLTGLQDGIVPESVNGDAFLPNELRTRLGLMDNSRRYARDCYALLTMLYTRDRLEIILNHLSTEGDPQTPSRLLMAVEPDSLASRVRWLLQPREPQHRLNASNAWVPKSGQTNIPIPYPVVKTPITDMAVTDFKKYSQCPYRFYLNKLQKARAFEHEKLELDGGGFGDLVHKCVESLFETELASSSDPDKIEAFLREELRSLAALQFGIQRPPALVIQLEQAQRRLQEFAIHQARWAAAGWRIKWIEHTVTKEDGITIPTVDGREMIVHGRIDRIDYNENSGEHAVLDYKTGDSTDKPRANHLKSGREWIDWQLPLYGVLIRSLGLTDFSKILFGYILLPKNPLETGFVIADFTQEEHAAAIQSAGEIALRVLESEFWPPQYKGVYQQDEYNGITQRSVARRWDKAIAERELEEAKQRHTEESESTKDQSASIAADSPKSPLGIESISTRRPPTSPNRIVYETHQASGVAPVDWFSPKMILASAGTGKTFNLAARALRLLFTDQPLDTILATTFTRKAAGEILHRVLMWLALAVDEPKSFEQLQEVLKPLSIDVETVKYQLSRLCSQLHRFRVSTLDSFYSQLARSFALELNLPPGWSLSDPFQTEQLKHEAISRMFESMSHSELRSLVSQLSKGEATRSIRREIEGVVSTGYDLFRRTTKEAWLNLHVPTAPSDREILDAVEIVMGSSHSNARYSDSRDRAIELFKAEDWGTFLAHTLVKNSHDEEPKFYRKEIDPNAACSFKTLARKAVSGELGSRRAQNEAAYDLMANYHAQLQWVKTRNRIVTFDDISERLSRWMENVVRSATGPTEGSMRSIAYRLDCPIDHLLLDEFQDTSPVQWEIVKPFAEAIVANQVSKTSFFCVGDTKQAIYGWRGGVSEIFESVADQISSVQKEQLVKSYRSSPVVIDFVNSVFSQLGKHEGYTPKSADQDGGETEAILSWVGRNFQPHETSRANLPGYVELRNADTERDGDDAEDEETDYFLDEVVDRIAALHREAPHIEIGVLSRTNQDIGAIINALRERGIEASQEGGNPLTDSSAVLLIQSALRLANHPADSLAHFHVCNSPLVPLFQETGTLSALSMSTIIRTWIDARGFGETVSRMARTIAPSCNARDQDRLRQLIQLGYRYDQLNAESLYGFVEFIDQHRVALPGANKIRVMTIHQSKGLEFDAVFLPSLDQNLLSRSPSFVPMYGDRTKPPIGVSKYISQELQKYMGDAWAIAFREYNHQQLAEALCLFYVALTRARQALYLYVTPSKNAKRTWGSVLQSIFANDDQRNSSGILLHSWGREDWYQDSAPKLPETAESDFVDKGADASRSDDGLSIALRETELAARILPSIRPSQKEQRRLVSLGSQWEAHDTRGAISGKLVHRWFEEIDGWIEDFIPNELKLLEIAAASLTQEEMNQDLVNEWVKRFLGYCKQPGLRSVLSRQRYADWSKPKPLRLEITTERKLLQILDDSLLRGIIDRCVVAFDGDRAVRAEIVDFKTDVRRQDVPLDKWLKQRLEFHYPQLAIYRRAIAEQYGLPTESILLTLVLLSEDQVLSI